MLGQRWVTDLLPALRSTALQAELSSLDLTLHSSDISLTSEVLPDIQGSGHYSDGWKPTFTQTKFRSSALKSLPLSLSRRYYSLAKAIASTV